MQIRDVLKKLRVMDIAGADLAHLVTVSPETPVPDTAARLKEFTIGALPVCDGERLVGILSERDIVHGLAVHGDALLTMTAGDLMTRDVETCNASDAPHEVMARMVASKFRHMPVMEGEKLAGIISSRDIAIHYANHGSPEEKAALMNNLTWV